MTKDFRSSNFEPTVRPLKASEFDATIAELLAVPGHADLLSVFAHNVQHNTDGDYYDGPIPLDPSLNMSQLLELRVISKDGGTVTAFGRYVVNRLFLDPEALAEGRIRPRIDQ